MSQPYIVDINPVAFHLGPVQVHWYGLMYMLEAGRVVASGSPAEVLGALH